MMGLVWETAQSGELTIAPDLHRNLAAESLSTELRHRQLAAALGHASEFLSAKGIEVATFKGVAAEQRWYDQIGDRPCWDVDLLVAPHSLPRAGELIEALQPEIRNDGRIQRLIDTGRLQAIDISFEGVILDIHFDLFRLGFGTRQPDRVWDRTVTLPIAEGVVVRALDAEMSLIFSLLHLNRDRFARLLGYVEVLRIIDRSDIDWEFVDSFVTGEGLETSHRLALAAVFEGLKVENPSYQVVGGWRGRVWNVLWRPSIRLRGEEGRLRFGRRGVLLFPFLVRGRGTDAARYLLRRMFPRRDMVDLMHPNSRGPYLWRLIQTRAGHLIRRIRERRTWRVSQRL
jgi:hypothetical protein